MEILKRFQKLIAIVLCVAMLLLFFPITAGATDSVTTDTEYIQMSDEILIPAYGGGTRSAIIAYDEGIY